MSHRADRPFSHLQGPTTSTDLGLTFQPAAAVEARRAAAPPLGLRARVDATGGPSEQRSAAGCIRAREKFEDVSAGQHKLLQLPARGEAWGGSGGLRGAHRGSEEQATGVVLLSQGL